MTIDELEELRRIADVMPPMTMVALDDMDDPELTRRALREAFEASLRSKESFSRMVSRLRGVAEMTLARAERIARTERTRAANGARMSAAIKEYIEAYEKAKKNHKRRPPLPEFEWIHRNVSREPRMHHAEISGTVRKIGQYFLPGLHYPGDPDAPARETINCHCYIRRWGGDV